MANEKKEYSKPDTANKDAIAQPDPETLNTTDPQDHMKGPISSLMHSIEDAAEDNSKKDAEDKAKEREN